MTQAIEITLVDVWRCNRLRGLSIKTCACRTPNGWSECPDGAIGLLDASVIRDAQQLTQLRTPAPALVTGEMCREEGCGGFMVRTGSCMTCQSCGFNEGCG